MNKAAQTIYDRLTVWLKEQNKHQEPDAELLELAANVRAEIDTLQDYINMHGTTYEAISRTGEVMHKHRPQHQQLVDARTRYLTILRDLGLTPAARNKVTQVDSEESLLDNLLQSK
jgi:P27 family predicted phage terminase small subunit